MLRWLFAVAGAVAACGPAAERPVCVETGRAVVGAADATPGGAASAKEAIGRVLDDWHDAAAHADEARYFGHFAEGAVFLGTDATERWSVPAFRAYAHPFFAKGKAWSFRAVRRAVDLATSAPIAWFDEDLSTPNLGPARGSGVLVLDGGRWKIAQYNLTLTVPNDRLDAVKRVLAGDAPAPAPP